MRTPDAHLKIDAEDTRKKLLDSAVKLFAENGYKGTTVRAITRNVNLSDSLLYHYFPNGKKQIFEAAVEENIKEISSSLSSLIGMKDCVKMPLADFLEVVYLSFMETVRTHLDIMRVILWETEVRKYVKSDRLTQIFGLEGLQIEEIFKHKAAEGEIKEMNFKAAALSINSILTNHVVTKLFNNGTSILEDDESRKRLIDYQMHMWLSSPA